MRYLITAIIGLTGLFLCGCNQDLNPSIITTKNVVHMPPAKFFNCPLVTLPNSFNSDQDVARTLGTAVGNNIVCHNNMGAIKSDLLNQQKIYGNK
jgi:hypothetical protein